MHGWWWDGGPGWTALISLVVMVVFWALIILGIVLIVRSLASGREARGADRTPRVEEHRSSALDLLQTRYARGEIDREEYLQRKADLES